MWSFIIKYVDEQAYSVRERVKNARFCTLNVICQNISNKKKTLHWSKVLHKTIWDFYLAHVHVFYKIIIFNSKVFKFQHDSSVTLNGNQSKNPNLSGEIDNNFHKN